MLTEQQLIEHEESMVVNEVCCQCTLVEITPTKGGCRPNDIHLVIGTYSTVLAVFDSL